jgi:DNA mismatch repair ATPase MutS
MAEQNPTPPALITVRDGLKQMAAPADIALDTLTNTIFTRGSKDDFLEQERWGTKQEPLTDYAMRTLTRIETDPAIILDRQNTVQAFMAAPELTQFLLTATIPKVVPQEREYRSEMYEYQKRRDFKERMERTTAYVAFIEGLNDLFPRDSGGTVAEFRTGLDAFMTEPRIMRIRNMVHDMTAPATLEVQAAFIPSAGEQYKCRHTYADITFASGEEERIFEREYGISSLHIPARQFFDATLQQIRETTGRKVRLVDGFVNLTVNVDQKKEYVTRGKAEVDRFSWRETLKQPLKRQWNLGIERKFETETVELDFSELQVKSSVFDRTVEESRVSAFEYRVESSGGDVNAIKPVAVQLRYFASIADFFNKVQAKGFPLVFPTLAPMEERKTIIDGMIEPNLIGTVPKPVANDVYADGNDNMRLITGPNNNGKTVYKDGIGLAMVQTAAGMPLIATSAVMSPKDNVITHYIRPGDIVARESRYAHDLSRVINLIKTATPDSLILVDEAFSGTDPTDGALELREVLEVLGDLGATTYASTHFHSVPARMGALPHVKNLHCAVEKTDGKLEYTYRILPGFSAESNGRYLARQMGADGPGLRKILADRVQTEGLKTRNPV